MMALATPMSSALVVYLAKLYASFGAYLTTFAFFFCTNVTPLAINSSLSLRFSSIFLMTASFSFPVPPLRGEIKLPNPFFFRESSPSIPGDSVNECGLFLGDTGCLAPGDAGCSVSFPETPDKDRSGGRLRGDTGGTVVEAVPLGDTCAAAAAAGFLTLLNVCLLNKVLVNFSEH